MSIKSAQQGIQPDCLPEHPSSNIERGQFGSVFCMMCFGLSTIKDDEDAMTGEFACLPRFFPALSINFVWHGS